MLEHLGLGIVLTMEDNFTPQANKAMGSMEKLQAQTEEMSHNIHSSLSNLQNLMLSGFSLNTVGDEFQRTGQKILGMFSNIGKALISTNSKFETIRAQFRTVFGSMQEAEKNLKWAGEFAIKTPFQMDDTAKAMQLMKSQGLDVTKTFKGINGEVKSFLEYMGDLSTRNMGVGGGFSGMGIAVSNYLSGSYTSLQKRFDLPKQDLEKLKGLTGDAFMQEFVNMTNKLAPNAMQNMVGTWQQTISEMQDTWDVFLWKVGEGGVFDNIKRTLNRLSYGLKELGTDKNIALMGDLFNTLWKPIDLIVTGLASAFRWMVKFSGEHPKIAKFFVTLTAISGVMLILSGAVMKTAGSFLIMTTSIISAYANLAMLKSLNIVSSFTGLSAGIGGLVKFLGVAGAVIGLFSLAWRNNFHGIRDNTMSSLNQVKSAWADSFEYMTSKQEYLQKVARRNKELNLFGDMDDKSKFTWYDNLVERLAKARALISGVFTALFGKKVDGKVFFSDAQINALRATGMLGFVRMLVMARGRAEEFTKGFAEGLTVVIGIGKKFLEFVLIPIKAILKGMYFVMKPTLDMIQKVFGGGNDGIDKSKGEQQMEMFKKIGQVAGTALGVILGFKAVKTISGVITSPFRALIGVLQQSSREIDNLKTKMTGTSGGNSTTLMHRALGFDRANRVNEVINRYDKTPRLTPTQQREGNLQRVYGNQMYDSFFNYNIKENDQANSNQVYTQPKGRLRRLLFGDQYLSPNGRGGMNRVGKFGGLFNIDRDDDRIRMSAEHFSSTQRGGVIDKGRPTDYARKMIGYRKRNGDLVNYDFTNSAQQFIQNRSGEDVINPVWRRKQGEIDRIMGQINSGRLRAEYTQSRAGELRDIRSRIPNMNSEVGTVRSLFRGQTPNNYHQLSQQFNQQVRAQGRANGVDWRQFNVGRNASEETRMLVNMRRQQAIDNIVSNSPHLQRLQSQMNSARTVQGQTVFKANRSKFSEALFGQRFYKLDRDANGDLYENTVARRGGIFRRPSRDMQYNEEGDTSLRGRLSRLRGNLSDRWNNSRLGQGVSSLRDRVSTGIRNARLGLGMQTALMAENFSNSRLGRGMSAVGGFMSRLNPLNMINTQRARLGWSPLAMPRLRGTGILGGIGRGVVGGARLAGRGIGALGRGTARVLGGGMRLAGGLLGGAMRALPAIGMGVALGRMAYQGIANRGAGITGQARTDLAKRNGLDSKQMSSNFLVGLASMREAVKKFDFKVMWTNFKSNAGTAWKLVKDMAKTIWGEIAKNGKSMMGEAWSGIKGMAVLAWDFIKANFAGAVQGIASNLGEVLGNAFSWLAKNGATTFGKIMDFVLYTAVPAIFNGLVSIGKTILANLPNLIKGILSILGTLLVSIGEFALKLGKGLLDGILGALANLGTAIGEIVVKGLKSFIYAVLPDGIAGTVTKAFGIHHQGLWMSSNEHQAIIRKDETVLPPDKSRKLDSLLESISGGRKATVANTAQGVGSGGTTNDNSIEIKEVKIIVQADSLSRTDARKQALMILEEFKKLQREKEVRQYT